MAYQSLYRTYRPQRFGELVGQEHVTTALRNAVHDGRTGHAYLFSGPRGTGKTTTARLLAKALNCLDLGEDGEPCGVCANCEAIAAGTFLDLFELDAASNRGVEDARQLAQSLALRSALGGKKVYILDEVHMLTKEAANTLLKSLEEPPDHVVFVLATTNPESVLPTIRSRTQHFEFTLLSTEQLRAHLADICAREGVDADPEALALIARAGAGSARDALSLLDQALAHASGRLDTAQVNALFGGAPFDRRTRILQGISAGDVPAVLIELSALLDAGHEPRRVADDLLGTARDAFLLHAGAGRVRLRVTPDEQAALQDLGDALGNALLVRVIETLGEAIVDMRGIDAADPRLVLEVALVRLARHEAGPPLALLAERVERLERALQTGAPPAAEPPSGASAVAPSPPGVSRRPGSKPALGAIRAQRAGASPPPSPAPPAPSSGPVAAGEGDAPAEDPAPAPTREPMTDGSDRPDPPDAPDPPDRPADGPAPVGTGSSSTGSPGTGSPGTGSPGTGSPGTGSPSTGSSDVPPPTPLDLDEVILAWADMLASFSPATRVACQHAQPIRIEGNTVVFGIAPSMLAFARDRFKNQAPTVRAAFAERFGHTPMFRLVPSEEVALVGAEPGGRNPTRRDTPARDAARGDTAPSDDDAPPRAPLDDEVSPEDLVDAEPAGPAVSSVGILEAELGATVVEERPRQPMEPS